MKIEANGNQVNYQLEGPLTGPVLMLSHSLATHLALWDPQVEALVRDFRILRYDILGHGGSDVLRGPYTLDGLAGQAGDLLDVLGIRQVHFLGLSLGGMIGQILALRCPERLASLLLCSTTCRIPAEARPLWQERIRIAESEGMEPLVEPTIARWLTPHYRSAHPDSVDRVRSMIRSTAPPGYSGCCRAIVDFDLAADIHAISLPTLIIAGEADQAMPVAMSRALQERIVGSELVIIPSASHLSNIEQPEAFSGAVMKFLNRTLGR
jgi:3-oxoadipate enol-lactonase